MTRQTTALITVSLWLAITAMAWSPVQATILLEADSRLICNESGQSSLPRRMTIRQVIDDSFFEDSLATEVGVTASYIFRVDVDSGKVVATGVLIKADGTEIDLPRVAGRMRDGDASKGKSTDAIFEVGDVIEWTVKLKNLAPLQGFDCWSLDVGVAGSDSALTQTNLIAIAGQTRSTK